MTGLFLALIPSLVTTVLHVGFGAAGGLSIAVLFLANSAGGVWAVRHAPRAATSLGAVGLVLGSAGLAAALALTSVIVFVIGAATNAKTRSEVFSAAYVVSYTALSVPSLAAGLLAGWWGLESTAYLYIAFVAVLSVLAAVHAGRPQAHQRTDDGRSATSAAESRHHVRHERIPC